MLQPSILEKPALAVIGMEASFLHALSPEGNNLEVIGELWTRFTQQVHRVPNRIGREMYGIIYERPKAKKSHSDELQYIAAVAVTSASDIAEGMVSFEVPAGTFAVFVHRGPIHQIGATMHAIYRDWLPQSGYRHAGTADVEVYDHRFCVAGEESEMEYWIPITDRQTNQATSTFPPKS